MACVINTLKSQGQIDKWIADYNSDLLKTNIAAHYDETAYTDYTTGLVSGNEAILKQLSTLKKLTGLIHKIEIKGITEDRSSNTMINGIIHSENGRFALLSSLSKKNGIMLRLFEIIRPFTGSTNESIPQIIDQQRALWQTHSNDHKPTSLVNEIYSLYPYYLNRGKLLEDRQSIIEEYGYMNNENWKITLTKKSLTVVNDQLAFEIGNYQSGGKGQYLLIWEKSNESQWKILFDSNF
jgi:hypothetical protein